jgi:hypothetical protein
MRKFNKLCGKRRTGIAADQTEASFYKETINRDP